MKRFQSFKAAEFVLIALIASNASPANAADRAARARTDDGARQAGAGLS